MSEANEVQFSLESLAFRPSVEPWLRPNLLLRLKMVIVYIIYIRDLQYVRGGGGLYYFLVMH